MTSVDVQDIEGVVKGSVNLPETIFGIEPSESAIYQTVKGFLTNQRQGNASTKTRAEVSLTKKKMHRQKGTGRARVGTAGSPIRIGGGVAHGPKPRDLHERVPKKIKRLAIKSALSLKAAEGGIRVLDQITMDEPKTKLIAGILDVLGVSGQKTLLLTGENLPNVVKSCRNIPGLGILPATQVSTYDVIKADTVILTQDAVGKLEGLWGSA
jgi:large subunit ribosomal protein L4